MKPALVTAVVALAAAVLLLWRPWEAGYAPGDPTTDGPEATPWLDRLARGIGLEGRGPPYFSGYVDADYVMATSSVGGTLLRLDVARGDHVTRGAPLFALDDAAERAVRDEAQARIAEAEAQLADLLKGKRQPEIDAILAQRAQAEAALAQAESDYRRQVRLRATGTSSAKQLEDATTQRDLARRRLDELDAELEVARMPARADEIRAARAAVAAARAALAQAEWRLDQKTGFAPADGLVFDTLYRPGEMVPAGAPVVQLLPPENIKIRL
ncbi:MAG: HlyD family efflux transporter periplasmic adaptor subunit, partial [Rhodospirillaceae bacterium]|nr:HlyD family efflux transporter periplasmic adaptor subunit [Rhodospirillaceae bacterium]